MANGPFRRRTWLSAIIGTALVPILVLGAAPVALAESAPSRSPGYDDGWDGPVDSQGVICWLLPWLCPKPGGTPTPSATPTPSVTPTPTATPTPEPTATPTPEPTITPVPEETETPTPEPGDEAPLDDLDVGLDPVTSPEGTPEESGDEGEPTFATATVTTLFGGAVTGARATLYRVTESGELELVTTAETDETGQAAMSWVDHGGSYKLEASAPGYKARWFRSAKTPADAIAFTVADIEAGQVSGISLPGDTRFRGTVRERLAPVAGLAVTLYRWSQGAGGFVALTPSIATDVEGRYAFDDLAAGDYRLRFGTGQYLGEGATFVDTLAEARTFGYDTYHDVVNDVQLATSGQPATLTTTVRAAGTGAALPATVKFYRVPADDGPIEEIGSIGADSAGVASVGVWDEGFEYTVFASAPGHVSAYLGGATAAAGAVVVTAAGLAIDAAATIELVPVPVVPGTITAPAPKITGTTRVGSTLTATTVDWAPAGVVKTYQWLRISGSKTTVISGASASTYTLALADLGSRIQVRVSGTLAGYQPVVNVLSAPTGTVGKGRLVPPRLSIIGKWIWGQILKADFGSWGQSGVKVGYQWYRNGVPIKGGTKQTYKLQKGDIGKKITVRIFGSLPGYEEETSAGASTAAVAPLALTVGTPKISGTAKVGATLKAKPGTWKPAAVKLKYQWLRGGKPIEGATKSTYKLVKADKGKKITVTVTGSASGYATESKTSASKTVAK